MYVFMCVHVDICVGAFPASSNGKEMNSAQLQAPLQF